jgi:SAM-dependent methyltransferase
MKRIKSAMHRYGEADFDRDYLRWGFHDLQTQIMEADSVLRIAGRNRPLHILDLACGPGVHAVHWAKQGHVVTGVDLSQTFIGKARERMSRENVSVQFIVSDIRSFADHGNYDVVTWIESSFFDEDIAKCIRRHLKEGGCFVHDIRNPENSRTKFRCGNYRTWREEGGVFYLERHETDDRTGSREDVWITIDPQRDVIEEKTNIVEHPMNLDQKIQALKKAGFKEIKLYTMEGQVFSGGPEPCWLWLVAKA